MPESVIDAVAAYLRESNANLGGGVRGEPPQRRARRAGARDRRALPRLPSRRDVVRPEHDDAQLRPDPHARAHARRGRRDPRHAPRPRRERRALARARPRPRPPCRLRRDPRGHDPRPRRPRAQADRPHAGRRLSARRRTRSGTTTDAARIVELAHEAGALAWADAVHYAPHGPIDVAALGVDVLLCSPYKFFGPHLGLAYGREELLRVLAAVQGAAGGRRAGRPPLRDRNARARAARGLRRRVEYLDELGWDAIRAHERALGERSSKACRTTARCTGSTTMDGRVPTFAFRVDGTAPREVGRAARRARDRGLGRRLLRRRGHGSGSGSNPTAPSARDSSTTTRSTRSTGSSPRWPSSRPRCRPWPPRRRRSSVDRGGGSGPARAHAARLARP